MLEIKNISKVYGEGTAKVVALNNVSLLVNEGDFIAVMGPSGSGKSTLLNVIGGLDHISSGEVILDGKRIDSLDENALVDVRRGKIAYVFQQYHLIPSLTALENVLLPLTFCGANDKNQKALDILKRVGLEERAEHKPSQLSGGEQQRVAIARALVNDPSLVLADEPTGNLDKQNSEALYHLILNLNKKFKQTFIIVTHNEMMASQASKVIELEYGRVKIPAGH